ncbi:MAG: cystathionine gamma-synthase [Ignavibacteria bacterium CG_4_8_14_3_um_filter_37_9]|nr:cystathionine gamma-synthase [Ignavibacteria bacterium]OIO23810.1 MAG: cystathionine gamma-synthase [Ignavibacteria bacterium CG1_02_37_35]PIP77067.1 MAG: cystathionine gamma-synthase [Ignavibacteria bacterium CG22_combo_CG10-13_8_21_14_all_37_15]PIS43984.1 MAG: cystathionine gamma-synthase [Ignavibacteria bacterium CG08_land_8_20_14_0_20_37_9]PIW98950.1 MAG: cystathionine gamma-synthase [Ignavibacteria bacterium CG_4_8_14_3_um_filter_37_9]PIX94007.1 MAG: cystathionine gamma-synthase [Ignav
MGFSTDAIHAGQKADLETGAVITPVYLTSTYHQPELGVHKGYEYGRTHNLTRAALEANIATLEKGKYGIAFASGLAAINSLMALLKCGDHVIVTDNVYGGTYRLFELIMTDFGISFSWVDTSTVKNIEAEIKPNTKMVYVETPTNPMLTLTDLKAVANLCKEKNLISVVDNTFMSPYFQRPIEFGIDIVLHSTTKYLNGHSDIIGGIVVTGNEKIQERLRYIQNAAGAVPSPFDCWLTLRSTKTLAVRMDRHNANAMKIAKYLTQHPKVKKVFYPGLTEHPQHELAKKQMSGFGGMISVEFDTFETAKQFLNNAKVFTLAESLGGVESLLCHPVSMTHASVPKEKREKFGLTEKLVRFSVGIEDVEDLIADIEQAIK